MTDPTCERCGEARNYSEWTCELFGTTGSMGMNFRPLKGGEPNWFWRWMQFLILGNRWRRVKR